MSNSQKNQESQEVRIGSIVEVEINGLEQVWEIVTGSNANIMKGRVSADAPLIKLIMGAKAGDKVRGEILGNVVVIELKKVLNTEFKSE
jgi:transcription elongation GreA/GreB family factor